MILMIILLTAQTALADTYHYTWYRDHIGDSESQAVFDTAYANALNGNSSFSLTTSEDWDINPYIFNLIQADYPELFWLYSYEVYGGRMVDEDGYYTSTMQYDFHPIPPWNGAYQQKTAFDKAVNKAIRKVRKIYKGKSKVKRLKSILQYIAKTCSYKRTTYDQTAYGVFIRKKAVCAGYSKAFKVLCDRFKIPCVVVPAMVNSVAHEFNFVKLGKSWYFIDPTWCDTGSSASYRYFLLGRKNSGCSNLHSAFGVPLPKLAKKDRK